MGHSGGIEAANSGACGSYLQVEPADAGCRCSPGSIVCAPGTRQVHHQSLLSRNAGQTVAESILCVVRHCLRALCYHPQACSARTSVDSSPVRGNPSCGPNPSFPSFWEQSLPPPAFHSSLWLPRRRPALEQCALEQRSPSQGTSPLGRVHGLGSY